jgi:hypothetical protein
MLGLMDAVRNVKSLLDPDRRPAPQSVTDQSQREIDIAQFVRKELEEMRGNTNRVSAEGIWLTNCAYTLGFDGLTYNTSMRQFQPINRSAAYLKKNRIHVNKILPTLQNRLSRLCQNPPEWEIVPESNDQEDKDAARLSEQVLQTLIDRCEVDLKRLQLLMWVQQCGHAYVRTYWDASAGDKILMPDGSVGFSGEVAIGVESPFSVFQDPLARSFEEVSHLTLARVRKLRYFRDTYPERGHLVREEGAWLQSAQYEARIMSMNTYGPSQGGSAYQPFKNSAIEIVRYEKPCPKYPNGRMIVAANGVLLDDKELPIGQIPLMKFADTIVAGKYYDETPVTHARPVQDQYNENLRRRASWNNKLLAGKYKAPRGSGIAQESLNDESGEVVYYNVVPNAPQNIEAIQVPTIPEYAYKEEDRLDNLINYIFGISDVSRGVLPSASIPAIGAQLLQEQDQTRLSVMTEQHERAWAKVFKHMLKTAELNYVMPRKMKLAGKDRQYIIREIEGRFLRGNNDVRVRRGSTQPNSKTLKRQDIVNTMSLGLLGDPKDPNVATKILAQLEFGDSEDMWLDYMTDMSQIKRGMDGMEQGIPAEVDEKDNNVLWCQELNRFRKGDKFQTLPPEIQNLFLANIQDRLNVMMPPGANNMPLPPLPPTPPPPLGAGGEAVAGLPPGTKPPGAEGEEQDSGAPPPEGPE